MADKKKDIIDQAVDEGQTPEEKAAYNEVFELYFKRDEVAAEKDAEESDGRHAPPDSMQSGDGNGAQGLGADRRGRTDDDGSDRRARRQREAGLRRRDGVAALRLSAQADPLTSR